MAHKRRRRRSNSQEIERANNRAHIRRHYKKLGLQSEKEYRAWCQRRGLGNGIAKSDRQIENERRLANRIAGDTILAAKRRNSRRPGNAIKELYEHSGHKGRLGLPYLYRIRSQFNHIGHGPERHALFRLFARVERVGDLFDLRPALEQLGEIEGNTYIEGMTALARRHADWIRPVERWNPDIHNPRRQFRSLVQHLAAEYDVPAFMDAAWLQGATTATQREQDWFLHVGRGGNIRTADTPVRLTKKMAHEFLRAPCDVTVAQALRWGQLVGQGGNEHQAGAVIGSRLGSCFDNEEFWATVIIFFARNPMLDPAQVGPMVDYIHNQKFASRQVVRPGGHIETEEPPQPNFSMGGRSVSKLLRQMDDWHEELANQVHPEEPPLDLKRSKKKWHRLMVWEHSEVGEFSLEEIDRSSGGRSCRWTVSELLSNRELVAEGQHMHHCIMSYAKSCRMRSTSIWSLSAREDGKPLERILTIAVDPRARIITQVRGRFNLVPNGRRSRGKAAVENRYYRLLMRSRNILERWMRQERLAANCQ